MLMMMFKITLTIITITITIGTIQLQMLITPIPQIQDWNYFFYLKMAANRSKNSSNKSEKNIEAKDIFKNEGLSTMRGRGIIRVICCVITVTHGSHPTPSLVPTSPTPQFPIHHFSKNTFSLSFWLPDFQGVGCLQALNKQMSLLNVCKLSFWSTAFLTRPRRL